MIFFKSVDEHQQFTMIHLTKIFRQKMFKLKMFGSLNPRFYKYTYSAFNTKKSVEIRENGSSCIIVNAVSSKKFIEKVFEVQIIDRPHAKF